MPKVAEPPVLNGVEPEPLDIPAIRQTARALLDYAKDQADKDNPDRRYTLKVPAWGNANVTLKRLPFAEVGRVQLQAGDDPIMAGRLLLHRCLVNPPFSPKEVDEIFDDEDQLEAALLLAEAAQAINKLGTQGRAAAALAFRVGDDV